MTVASQDAGCKFATPADCKPVLRWEMVVGQDRVVLPLHRLHFALHVDMFMQKMTHI